MILLILLSISMSICLDAWMEYGMILHWYYRLLLKYSNLELDADGNIINSRWFYKPLGGCMKCMNVWISLLCLLIYLVFPILIPILLVIFISNAIIIKWS